MKGLILKDFYLVKFMLIVFLVISVAYNIFTVTASVTANEFLLNLLMYPMILPGTTMINALAFEEKYKWTLFADTLPCSRAKAVSARYILTAIIVGIFFIFVAITLGIISFNLGVDYSAMAALLFSFGLLPPVLTFPVQYKFGASKAKIANIIAVIVICCSVIGCMEFSTDFYIRGYRFVPTYFSFIVIAVTVILFLLSWALSVHIYKEREL